LDELFDRHYPVAYRVAYRLLGQECDALDAVQEGFANAISHLSRFRGVSSFKTWLLRVVSNAALDLGRHRKRPDSRFHAGILEDHDAIQNSDDPPDAGLERADLRERLAQALDELPEQQRQTFVLHVDGDLSYQEVADLLGISIGTVMSRIFYARKRLQSKLADYVCP
jgi:RNA polymerase sigma-70 factor (ECF subfamily)